MSAQHRSDDREQVHRALLAVAERRVVLSTDVDALVAWLAAERRREHRAIVDHLRHVASDPKSGCSATGAAAIHGVADGLERLGPLS